MDILVITMPWLCITGRSAAEIASMSSLPHRLGTCCCEPTKSLVSISHHVRHYVMLGDDFTTR
eukprot:1183912-Prorocentrum_minimum.AAC.3